LNSLRSSARISLAPFSNLLPQQRSAWVDALALSFQAPKIDCRLPVVTLEFVAKEEFNDTLYGCTVSAMRDLKIDKLSDEFGQYLIFIEYACGRLADIVKRMRCSKCNRKKCTARAVEQQKPRALRDDRYRCRIRADF
jgi:hypothetical protein